MLLARVEAQTFFGIRHGLETLFQLMGYDELRGQYIINKKVEITDQPQFRHRGVSVDTARNFIPIQTLKNVIDGMAFSKLNVFHWHITDTQSFPIQLDKYPSTTGKLVEYGAYGPAKIYSKLQVKDLITYATKRGDDIRDIIYRVYLIWRSFFGFATK